MAVIGLSRNKVAMIDDVDFDLVSQRKWHAQISGATWYARSCLPDGKVIQMHRLILGVPRTQMIDHIDGDGLNNRRENLRVATAIENCRNRRVMSGGTSQLKGVSWRRHARRWLARIKIDGLQHYIGEFLNEQEAGAAYDAAAVAMFGEFARLNFPDDGTNSAERHSQRVLRLKEKVLAARKGGE